MCCSHTPMDGNIVISKSPNLYETWKPRQRTKEKIVMPSKYQAELDVCTCIHRETHICMYHVCMYMCICIYIMCIMYGHICICVNTYAYIHIYIHIYIHTHIHTLCVCVCVCVRGIYSFMLIENESICLF
jgi:hypothetical protein